MAGEKKTRLQVICNYSKYIVMAGMVLLVLVTVLLLLLLAVMIADPTASFEGVDRDGLFYLTVIGLVNQFFSMLIFYMLYKLVRSLGVETTPFRIENVRLLKQMAYLFVAGWLLALALEAVLSVVMSVTMPGLNADALLMGGIVYVISLVFEYGVRLQEESDGFV